MGEGARVTGGMQVWWMRMLGVALVLIHGGLAHGARAGDVAQAVGVAIHVDDRETEGARGDEALSWSATPLDLPEGSDVVSAMVFTPDPIVGTWQVELVPGRYLISGFSDSSVYEATVEVGQATRDIAVPPLAMAQEAAFRCTEQPVCALRDSATGLGFALPAGWAAEQPYHADLGGGAKATEISAVFYEEIEGDGGAVWFLNPVEWIEDDSGPCEQTGLGPICTFETSEAARKALAIIAPSLTAG